MSVCMYVCIYDFNLVIIFMRFRQKRNDIIGIKPKPDALRGIPINWEIN